MEGNNGNITPIVAKDSGISTSEITSKNTLFSDSIKFETSPLGDAHTSETEVSVDLQTVAGTNVF